MNDQEIEDHLQRVSYDVATLFRVAPWVFLMGDKRNPQSLVKAALGDAKGFIELDRADSTQSRQALMRGLLVNWFNAMGVNPDSRAIEMLVSLVAQAVDEDFSLKHDGLSGEHA